MLPDAQTKLGGFSEGETIRNLSASHPHAETSASIPTLDRLLFAVTPLTVSEHETGDHTVNFSPGTIRVSLHLDGVSVQPVVHITGMESALRPVFDETSGTWRLQSVSRNKTFQPAVAYDVTNRHANATTDIPRFKADTPRHGGNYRSHHGKPYRAPDFVGRAYCPLPHTDGGRY